MSVLVMPSCLQHYTELPAKAGDDSRTSLKRKTMWSRLGQRFNPAGILLTLRVIIRDPHLAIPHISVPDITHLDWKALKRSGFRGVLFDKDNTLTPPYLPSLWPSLFSSLEDCKATFEGNIAIFSNSAEQGLANMIPMAQKQKLWRLSWESQSYAMDAKSQLVLLKM